MSDTTNEPGMFPPEAPAPTPGSSSGGGTDTPIVAYCQQCGRPLTATSERRVGSGIFCQPCAMVRSAEPARWTSVHTGNPVAGPPGSHAGPVAASEPNPLLAGFLGLIPGVGAMFNGQYAKGAIHLIVFVVLVSLADNLSWVLWWLVWGWVFYQAFEAYHTALARRDGQPLPDPFGWNDLGDRMGFPRSSPGARESQASQANATPTPAATVFASSAAAARPSPPEFPTDTLGGDAVGSHTGAPPYPPRANAAAATSPVGSGSYTQVPYTSTFSGTAGAGAGAQPLPSVAGSRRFPAGALWLIGLGLLFLLENLIPDWHLEARWVVPILLTAVALWIGGTRLSSLRSGGLPISAATMQAEATDTLVFPVLLLSVSVLLILQNLAVVPFRRSWPALLIAWGGMLLLRRMAAPALPVAGSPPRGVPPDTFPR